uniref:Uncharacterized protein n=1 Tax=Salix viminalis TaxID=40686 RepID=A0A6N2KNN2_SALVM
MGWMGHESQAPPLNSKKRKQFAPILKHRRSEPVVNYWNGSAVFLLDGKDKSEKDNQVEKQEFYDGGSGKNPRGGEGGGDDGSGESEDEGLFGIIDETMQYVYIISGEELARLGKDYIKFLFGKRQECSFEENHEQVGKGSSSRGMRRRKIPFGLTAQKSARRSSGPSVII